MNRDLFIFIAFCVFALLVGMRLKQRFGSKKTDDGTKVSKNQRPKMANEPPEVVAKRKKREKRVRIFVIVQLVVVFGLIVFMIPALTKDLMSLSTVDPVNVFLRCLIFVVAILVFVTGYMKVFRRNTPDSSN